MDGGIRIYNTSSQLIMSLSSAIIDEAEICALLPHSYLLAVKLVLSDSEVRIFDVKKMAFLFQYNVSDKILSLQLRKDRIFIVQSRSVDVFTISKNPERVFAVDTADNPKGLCVVTAPSSQKNLMVVPFDDGCIQIYDLNSCTKMRAEPLSMIKAHSSDIAAIALDKSGLMVATASLKGTLIRVFDVCSLQKLHEFRRGTEPALIHCLKFANDGKFLCCASNRKTVHMFALESAPESSGYASSYIRSFLRCLHYPKSFAQMDVGTDAKSTCMFGRNQQFHIIMHSGMIYNFTYDNSQGCANRGESKFFADGDEEVWFDAKEHLQNSGSTLW